MWLESAFRWPTKGHPHHCFKKPCKGAGSSGSPSLEEIFRRQTTQASPKSPEDTASGHSHTSQHAPQEEQSTFKKPRLPPQQQNEPPEPNVLDTGPTPRRLHFPTMLDQHTQGSLANQPEQAMTPSQQDPSSREATSPGHADVDGEETSINVDYF